MSRGLERGANRIRQVLQPDLLAAGERHRGLERFLNLSDVQWPSVAKDRSRCFAMKHQGGCFLGRNPLEQRSNQNSQVLAAFAHRRQMEGQPTNSHIEILPELSASTQLPHFPLRR